MTTDRPVSDKLFQLEDLPVFTLNLDQPPEKRWLPIIRVYRDEILNCYQILEKRIQDVIGRYPGWAFKTLLQTITFMYGSRNHYYPELKSIADELGIPVSKVILVQYGYEFFTACTSGITDDNTNTVHLRTMDWDDNTLRPLTMELNITKGGHSIATATTWAGFIGFMTIVKHDMCSISVNYRRSDIKSLYYPLNLVYMIQGRLSVSYLVREAVLGEYPTYLDILDHLEMTPISVPCYITMTGVASGSGVVLVRDRNDCHTRHIELKKRPLYTVQYCSDSLDEVDLTGFLVQSNNDPGDFRKSRDDKHSGARRRYFKSVVYPYLCGIRFQGTKLDTNFKMEQNIDRITNVFLQPPILKYNTVYYNIMVPSGYLTQEGKKKYSHSKLIFPDKSLPNLGNGLLVRFWDEHPVPEYPILDQKRVAAAQLNVEPPTTL